MDLHQQVIINVCFLLVFTIQKGSTIDCWVCTSDDEGCGESIDSVILQTNKKTESGCAGCGKDFKSLGTMFSSVERTCLTTASDTCDNKLGFGSCSCSRTFCNGQNHVKSNSALVIVTSLFLLIWKHFVR